MNAHYEKDAASWTGWVFVDSDGRRWPASSQRPVEAEIEYATKAVQDASGPDPEGDALAEAVAAQFAGLEALFWDRQRKYGPGNIAEFGDHGILVRLYDKLARLKRYYVEGVGDMPDESVNDAWADVSVYAMIALLCRSGRWPGWSPRP